MNIRAGLFCLVLYSLFAPSIQAADLDKGFDAALASEQRPAEDKALDAARKPRQVMEFLGVGAGMTVMDVIAGGGYFTEVLSAAVGSKGRVISQNSERLLQMGDGAMARAFKARVDRLGNADILLSSLSELNPEESPYSPAGSTILGAVQTTPAVYTDKLDVALTDLNLHDVYIFGGEDAAVAMLKTIFTMLKPGGVFGVIDHVGIAGQDNSKLHRIEPELARRLITSTGFKIEAESNLLANPADDHTMNVHDASLGRNTDRLFFKAVRPKAD